ncbi:MAG: HAMP domain-containing protein [bacterium]|nr:HAMP domain-containing protein [bacterium]MCP5068841.1 HAMP domain-containing protein [bacterium]
MERFRKARLQTRLMLAIIGTTVVALVALTGVLLGVETWMNRNALVENHTITADMTGRHSLAALLFDDEAAAAETLRALAAEPDIAAAAIYRSDGTRLADFKQETNSVFPETLDSEPIYRGEYLEISRPVFDGRSEVGSVFLRVHTRGIMARTTRYLAVAGVVLALVLALASGAAAALMRSLSRPIGMLVEHSKSLTQGDLTASVPEEGDDEIGSLARAFNAMGESLRKLVSEIDESGRGVTDAAGQIRSTSVGVIEESQRQLDAVETTGLSIGQVATAVEQVATSVDELAAQARTTSSSMEHMDQSITVVADSSTELSEAIDGIAQAIGHLNERSNEMANGIDELGEVTTTAESSVLEQTRAIRLVRDNAQSTQELSQQNATEAERGMRSVQDTITAIQEIEASFVNLVTVVTALAERSRSIGEIVDVINDVAGETQLLSLNASIIAAQAGENGRAFAVVANQVKELADRTGQSTGEISQLISHIQEETGQAVTAVGEGESRVAVGVARSREAGDRLRAILEAARTSHERVDQIVRATESQSEEIGRVEGAMGGMREMVERVHDTISHQKRTSGEIIGGVGQVRNLAAKVQGATAQQRSESAQVVQAIEQVAEGLAQIRGATQNQLGASAQVEGARDIFREIAEENARRSSSLGEIVGALTDRAEALARAVGRFRV